MLNISFLHFIIETPSISSNAEVNTARFLNIDPEFALTGTIEKFIRRFEYIETNATKYGKQMEKMTLNEMDLIWNEAKNK